MPCDDEGHCGTDLRRRRRGRCRSQSRVRDKDDPTEVVSSLLGKVETKNLLRKSKPAFFALQELSVMVRPCSPYLLGLCLPGVEHVAAPRHGFS